MEQLKEFFKERPGVVVSRDELLNRFPWGIRHLDKNLASLRAHWNVDCAKGEENFISRGRPAEYIYQPHWRTGWKHYFFGAVGL